MAVTSLPSTVRASWWSITINNPTDEDRKLLEKQNLPSFVKSIHSQDEVGDEGTPHIQGAVNTTQVRFSEVKKWLPRAHIEPARNKDALLKYVKKTETAVAGTQFVVQADYLSMEAYMRALAAAAREEPDWTQFMMEMTFEQIAKKRDQWARDEYWEIANEILLEKPSIIGLISNPQMERAWVRTRRTWIQILDRQDRQTESEEA